MTKVTTPSAGMQITPDLLLHSAACNGLSLAAILPASVGPVSVELTATGGWPCDSLQLSFRDERGIVLASSGTVR